jgi:hypothetical protein
MRTKESLRSNFTLRTETAFYIDETSTIYLCLPTSGAVLERVSVLQDLVKLCRVENKRASNNEK